MCKHYQLAVAIEVGSFEEAEQLAADALNLYPKNWSRVAHLAHDYCVLLVRYRLFRPALTLLEATARFFVTPHLQILHAGTLAGAYGGLGRRDEFDALASRILLLAKIVDANAAAGLLGLGDGARLLGQEQRAREFGGEALAIAKRRREGCTARLAERLLQELSSGNVAFAERSPTPATEHLVWRFLRRLALLTAPMPLGAPGETPSALILTSGHEDNSSGA